MDSHGVMNEEMKWIKSSQGLMDMSEQLIPEAPSVEKRKMFGYPCCFVNGNMFMGLHQENMFLRLSEHDRKAFLEIENAHQFEPMPGRVMREYVVIPPDMVENHEAINIWIRKSLEYVSGLLPKTKKKKHAHVT
jgi:TfoX/Sxy family transcriptional regulator of competence genes